MATYCADSDLLIGDLAVGGAQVPAKFVQDATDEIDSKLGQRYVVPLTLSSLSYASRTLIKRLAVYLATGGFLVNAYHGDKSLHATGMEYLKEARATLVKLVDGDYLIEGAAITGNLGTDSGPGIVNVDDHSRVEGYYASTELGPRWPFPNDAYGPWGWRQDAW